MKYNIRSVLIMVFAALFCVGCGAKRSESVISSEAASAIEQIQRWETEHPQKHLRTTTRNNDGQIFRVDFYSFKENEKQLWRTKFQSAKPAFQYVIFPVNGTNFCYFPVSGLVVAHSSSSNGVLTGVYDSAIRNVDINQVKAFASQVSLKRHASDSEIVINYDGKKMAAAGMIAARMAAKPLSTHIFYDETSRVTGIINQFGEMESDVAIEYLSLDPETIRRDAPQVVDPGLADLDKSFSQALMEETILTRRIADNAIFKESDQKSVFPESHFATILDRNQGNKSSLIKSIVKWGGAPATVLIVCGLVGSWVLLARVRGMEKRKALKRFLLLALTCTASFLAAFAIVPHNWRVTLCFVYANLLIFLIGMLVVKLPKQTM